ncbi:MAG: bifunctional diguanylate cyclase/phosphodiesterase, partial [Rubrivivax sp.]|nr:bifunctional diguanylate cyclase/phosphodiesterase [Rubrivivax sp.]
ARHIAAHVPDIDLVFSGDLPTPQAQERLTSLRGTAGLFRFKLYDPGGRLLLVSESVGTAPRPEDISAADRAKAARAAREGTNLIELRRGGDGRPEVYSEAYVPVRHGRHVIGVVEVYLDQTEVARTTAASFRGAVLTASSVLGGVFLLGALLWRWRVRHERDTESRLQYLSRHDVLTGALNAASFRDALEHACAERPDGKPDLAVLCIDLDRFSDVNDAHGHASGDRLLRLVAERLRGVLRDADLLARLAGDRYAVLQREACDSASVKALAQRIIDSLTQPYAMAGAAGPVVVTSSVGVAIHGVDGMDADTLLHNAELALQRAKSGGCASWSFYDAALDRALQDRRSLARDLRKALADGELELHFQPVFAAHGQGLIGYEALARWPHPTRGMVPPVEFIPVAEEFGDIEALGRWVLQRACQEAVAWPASVSVAVNLSPAQFRRQGAIVDEVRSALASSGLSPRRLELEITESLLMSDTEEVLVTLHSLHALGVRIAMDDFGTGYSSLAYLWRFPFDKLKIDRAFTQGLGGDGKVDVIVRSIVTLAHTLSIRVNAEGVETDVQRQALCRHGCDELQGYLLGRPMPVERLPHHARHTVPAAALPPPFALANAAD